MKELLSWGTGGPQVGKGGGEGQEEGVGKASISHKASISNSNAQATPCTVVPACLADEHLQTALGLGSIHELSNLKLSLEWMWRFRVYACNLVQGPELQG
jgi:hypothetical protein